MKCTNFRLDRLINLLRLISCSLTCGAKGLPDIETGAIWEIWDRNNDLRPPFFGCGVTASQFWIKTYTSDIVDTVMVVYSCWNAADTKWNALTTTRLIARVASLFPNNVLLIMITSCYEAATLNSNRGKPKLQSAQKLSIWAMHRGAAR